jgi:hypothetical protein
VNEPTAARALPDIVLLGDPPGSPFPGLDGYNLTYLRPGATMGVVTTDEYKAPVLAFWHRGLGRIAALTAEVDGRYSKRLNAWTDFQAFGIGLGRWLLGGTPPSGVQGSLAREGGQGVVRVELDPGRARGSAADVRAATAAIVPPGTAAGTPSQRLPLTWVSDDALEGRFPIQKAGMYLGAVQLGNGGVLPLAPLSLPYSPEFESRVDPAEGLKTLEEIARVTGGLQRAAWDDVFSASRLRNRQVRDFVLPLTLMLLVLHVAEIAGRRLLLFAAAQAWVRGVRIPAVRELVRRWRPTRAAPPEASAEAPAPPQAPDTPAAPSATPPKPAVSPLARAKAKARGRLRG